MKEHVAALHRLTKIPGVDLYAAQGLVSEIGPKAAAFGNAEQFAVRAVSSRRAFITAIVRPSAPASRGLLYQIAWTAIPTKDTFFASLLARLKPRVKSKSAAWAVAHHIAKIVLLVLHQKAEYQELPRPTSARWSLGGKDCPQTAH
jgi:transposase